MATLAAVRHAVDDESLGADDRDDAGHLVAAQEIALVAMALLGLGAAVVLAHIADTSEWKLPAAPFFGQWDLRVGWRVMFPTGLGVAVVIWGPRLAARLSWPWLLMTTSAASVAWAVALAIVDGGGALAAPLTNDHDYLAVVPQIHSAGTFLDTFVDRLPAFPTHVQGHPPGMPLLFWAGDRVGLAGPGWAAGIVLGGWALVAPAMLVMVDDLAGRQPARRVAPFLVVLPAAVWAATSADALFAGVVATATALVVLASGRRGAAAALLAIGGGVLGGGALLLTYGAAPLALVAAAVAAVRRRVDVVLLAGAGACAVLGAAAGAGFWWPDGLVATRVQYERGVADLRPATYFLWANLVVFAVACGPAAVAGLAHVRGRMGLMVGAGLGALLVADLSLLSKGEVERIWLLFVPFVAVAAVALHRHIRAWLAATAVTGLAMQVMLRSPW